MSTSASSACSPSPPRGAPDAVLAILLAPEVLLAHEVLAFVVANRQLLHGLPAEAGARLERAATCAVLRLAGRDPAGARDAASTTAATLEAAVACGALGEAQAALPRTRLARLRRALARRARAT
ncbi:MAG: hypothetical protein HY906_10030 [Deltaproteobacteria bacterium]|nr:hypothetical protein [Deltaproteobacteria bacterium]